MGLQWKDNIAFYCLVPPDNFEFVTAKSNIVFYLYFFSPNKQVNTIKQTASFWSIKTAWLEEFTSKYSKM